MILDPSVLALTTLSAATAALLAYGAAWGSVLLRRWDLRSGSALQLRLERRTYLLSTLAAYALAMEVLSLFLYVHTADALAPLFPGAMCAAGTLHVNAYGYPVLALKVANTVLAGLWLALNHADAQGYDYPLIGHKYAALMGLAALVVVEAVLQTLFFTSLRPRIITSCCGSLFSARAAGPGGSVASLPGSATAAAFYAVTGGAVVAALAFRRTGRGGALLAALAAATIPVSIAAIVAHLSPYVYELPTHRCPFCLLKPEYHLVGYVLYAAVLGAGISGVSVGLLLPFRRVPSLAEAVPRFQRRLAAAAATCGAVLLAVAAWEVATSGLRT